MARKRRKSAKQTRRQYSDDFKEEAVRMLLDGHSAISVAENLGLSGTSLLYRWKNDKEGDVLPIVTVSKSDRFNTFAFSQCSHTSFEPKYGADKSIGCTSDTHQNDRQEHKGGDYRHT